MREELFDIPKGTGYTCVFDGEIDKIPLAGTLVAIETASNGLVNCVTTGEYNLRKSPVQKFYQPDSDTPNEYRECSSRGEFLVSVEVRYADRPDSTNMRWLDELHFPVLKREVLKDEHDT